MTITMSDSNNSCSRENYDFDSLGTLENVLDNNLSKSKKEAVLLRRLTDRRRKPSKKFRHNQNSRSTDYSNNEFLDDFLDHTSINLKKSNSMNLLDLTDDRESLNRSINQIDKFENKNHQQVKLRAAEEVTNRRRISTPLLIANSKTHSVCYLPTQLTPVSNSVTRQSSFSQEKSIESDMKDEIEIKISLSSEIMDLNTNLGTKNQLFNVSVDQIQNELGKLKVIEKSAPKVIKFNPAETTSPAKQENSTNHESGKSKILYSKSMHNITKNAKDNKITAKNITEVETTFKSDSMSLFESKQSNSFQRSPSIPKTQENVSSKQQQQFTTNFKTATSIRQNENSENIKPPTPKLLQQHMSNNQTLNTPQNIIKKTKIESSTNTEPTLGKTVINVAFNSNNNNNNNNTGPSNRNNKIPSNFPQTQVSKSPAQTSSTPTTNVLTENNNNSSKWIESNPNIPSWKLELMKRKRNLKDDKIADNPQNHVILTDQKQNQSSNLTILVTPELKKTVIQTNSLKPTFQSNFVNNEPIKYQKKEESDKLIPPATSNYSTNTPSKTTIIIQNNSKLIHNSIGSPIVFSATPTANTTTEQPKQYSFDPLIPEWKRTLLEKKKLKKTF